MNSSLILIILAVVIVAASAAVYFLLFAENKPSNPNFRSLMSSAPHRPRAGDSSRSQQVRKLDLNSSGEEFKKKRNDFPPYNTKAAKICSMEQYYTGMFHAAEVGFGLFISFVLMGFADFHFLVRGFAFFGPVIARFLLLNAVDRRFKRFDADYPAFLLSLVGLLKTGMNPLGALESAASGLEENSLVRQEVLMMIERLRLGVSEEKSIGSFGEDIYHPEIELFVQALLLNRRVGGALSDTLERLAKQVRRRQYFRSSANAAVGMQRGSILIILCILVGIEFYLWLSYPVFVTGAMQTDLGWTIWQVSGVLIALGILWVRVVTKIKSLNMEGGAIMGIAAVVAGLAAILGIVYFLIAPKKSNSVRSLMSTATLHSPLGSKSDFGQLDNSEQLEQAKLMAKSPSAKGSTDIGWLFFQAGIFREEEKRDFHRIKLAAPLVGAAVIGWGLSLAGSDFMAIGAILGAVIGLRVPRGFIIERRKKARQEEITFFLPLVIEQIIIGVSSSLDINPCIQRVVQMADERDSHNPVTELFKIAQAHVKAGVSMEQALTEIGKASGCVELKHAFMSLAQVVRHGGETKQLQELADSVTAQREARIEGKIKRLELEATFPVTLVFIGFFLIILAGFGSQIMGIFS